MSARDVVLCECFARDGLQHEPDFIDTATKVDLVDRFAALGFEREMCIRDIFHFVHGLDAGQWHVQAVGSGDQVGFPQHAGRVKAREGAARLRPILAVYHQPARLL